MQKAKTLPNDKRIILFLFYFLILMPDFVKSLLHGANIVSTGIRGISGLIALFLFLTRKQSKSLLYLSVYIIYILAVTLLKSFSINNIIRFVAIYADIFTIAVFTDYLLENDTVVYIRVMNFVSWGGLLLNTISVFLFPNGIVKVANEAGVYFPYYFYDYDNRFILRYVASFAIIFLYEKYYKGKEKGGWATSIAMLIGLSTLIKLHSSASMVALILIIVAYCLIDIVPERIVSVSSVWIAYLLVSLVTAVGLSLTLSTKLIDSLGKTSSFVKRTKMWTIALQKIPKNILFGTGIINSTDMKSVYGYAQLHNSLFTTLLWGGSIGLLLYSLFVFSIKLNEKGTKDQITSKFMTILFAGIMITSLVDGIELVSNTYMFYFIIANSERVSKAFESVKTRVCHQKKLTIKRRGTIWS